MVEKQSLSDKMVLLSTFHKIIDFNKAVIFITSFSKIFKGTDANVFVE